MNQILNVVFLLLLVQVCPLICQINNGSRLFDLQSIDYFKYKEALFTWAKFQLLKE